MAKRITHRDVLGASRNMYGWVPDRPDPRDLKIKASFFKALILPKRVDLKSLCSRVENQSSLGSCTAHAATSAIEFLYKKLKIEQPELSRLFVYFATRVWVAGEPPTNDNGAMIRDVMKALSTYGACYESLWPYLLDSWTKEPSGEAKNNATSHQILHYYRCPSLRQVKTCLADGYPVVGGFVVPQSIESLETTKTGLIRYPNPRESMEGGHAVLFVGYDDTNKLLTFQNSWGPRWGDRGFGYLPYAYVENRLASDFWTVRLAEL